MKERSADTSITTPLLSVQYNDFLGGPSTARLPTDLMSSGRDFTASLLPLCRDNWYIRFLFDQYIWEDSVRKSGDKTIFLDLCVSLDLLLRSISSDPKPNSVVSKYKE